MKRIIIAAIFTMSILAVSQAQETRLNHYSGYVFDDSFETINSSASFYRGKIKGGYQWGFGIEHLPFEDYGIELLYYRQDTDVPVDYYSLIEKRRDLEASLNYIMLGGVRYAGNEQVQGYGGAMLGMVIYDNKEPQAGEPNSVTKFAWGLRLGANIWATDKIGLKIQTQLVSGVQAFNGGFYLGTGGSGAAVSGFSTLHQFTLGGGLTIRLGE